MSSREPGSLRESFGKLRCATTVCGLLAVAFACLLAGCRALETPTDLAAALSQHDASHRRALDAAARKSAPLPEPTPPAELTDDGWAAGSATQENGEPATFHWQHAGLAKLLALPAEDRPDFAQFLEGENPVAVTNAAIVLARAGDETVDRCLVEAVRNENLKLAQRRAAVEAIASEEGSIAAPALAELLDDYANSVAPGYSPELHAELLRNSGATCRRLDESILRRRADFQKCRRSPGRPVRVYDQPLRRVAGSRCGAAQRYQSPRASRDAGVPGGAASSTGARICRSGAHRFPPRCPPGGRTGVGRLGGRESTHRFAATADPRARDNSRRRDPGAWRLPETT